MSSCPSIAISERNVAGRTTSRPGYGVCQRIRKRVEEIFGWAKTVGVFRRTRFRGSARTPMAAYIVGAAYHLTRMSRLLATPTSSTAREIASGLPITWGRERERGRLEGVAGGNRRGDQQEGREAELTGDAVVVAHARELTFNAAVGAIHCDLAVVLRRALEGDEHCRQA